MARVAVNEAVLNWAFERSGLTIERLRKKFPKLDLWLTGQVHPTMKQLEDLAKATRTPFGYFFLSRPPEERLPIPLLRTESGSPAFQPSPDFIDTLHAMQRRQAWMREFLMEEGEPPLSFVNTAKLDDPPIKIALRMREALGLKEDWADAERTWTDALRVLMKTMDKAGIVVVINGVVGNNTHRKLDPGEFRGFVLVDEYAPLVFVNGADSKAAQMFTLAHELAHIFFGKSAAFDLREMQPADDPMEKACDQVAAEFLVPENKLRQIWDSLKTEADPFQIIAQQFKVSSIVAARRALDLQLINKDTFFNFYSQYRETKRGERQDLKKQGGGDFYLNQNFRIGRRFAMTVAWAVREGKLLYSDAYRLTGLFGKTFVSYIQYLESGKQG